MNLKKIIALVLGLMALLLPLVLPLEGLSLAGRINLGIFLMASLFWVMEPIPIFATSVVVILLQVIFLSGQGPLAQWTEPEPVYAVELAPEVYQLPASSLGEDGQIFVFDGRWKSIKVDVMELSVDWVTFRSDKLDLAASVAENANNWMLAFQPPHYSVYFGTLASPIIILFLGGFVLAAGAVKYQLDRNLCRLILRPFGTRPASIVLGLMLVTALLSGFMSNTATTAMMMAVILPIIASSSSKDRFAVALALCIPFAANIGGILTPIGTPPNAIAINALIARGVEMPFTSWMMLTAPLVLVMLLLIWFLLMRLYPSSEANLPLKLDGVFNISGKAWCLYLIFGGTVLLWVTESLHGVPSGLIAFIPVALLPATGVVDQKDIRSLPWEVLWLMAGGIALGMAMGQTGLALWMVEIIPWDNFSGGMVLAAFGIVAILLATFIANTVAATLLIPIMMTLVASGVGGGFAVESAALMVAVGASLGMSLPISTPPNAIAMSTGLLKSIDMVRAGVVVGIAGYLLLLLSVFFFWNHVF